MNHLNKELGILKENKPSNFPCFTDAYAVASFSDYSGDHDGTKYQALSFLIINLDLIDQFVDSIKKLREARWKDNSYIDFKSLNKDKCRREILSAFLDASNSLTGSIATFLIHKDIRWFFGRTDGKLPPQILEEEGLGKWKHSTADRLLRIVHLNSFLLSGLSYPKNKIFWHTDRDPITQGGNRLKILGEVFHRVLNIYTNHPFEFVGYGEKFEEDNNVFSHLLSLPDLAAGALIELIENKDDAVQIKTAEILKWLAGNSSSLKRLICKIDRDNGNQNTFRTSFITLSLKH